MFEIINKIKCLLGLHDFPEGGAIYQSPNPTFEIISIEQKCTRCMAKKTTFQNKNTGEINKSFVLRA